LLTISLSADPMLTSIRTLSDSVVTRTLIMDEGRPALRGLRAWQYFLRWLNTPDPPAVPVR
jgi:hypothetical protein